MDHVERKHAWNMSSNGDSVIKPALEVLSWPTLSETNKAYSNKSSSDSLISMSDTSEPSVTYESLRQNILATELLNSTYELLSRQINTYVPANSVVVQPSGQSSSGLPKCPLSYSFPRGQDQRNEIASQSHGGTQNQHQWNPYKNQNGNHHHHQRHGGLCSHGHWNQNSNGRDGITQAPRGIPEFVIHAPTTPMAPVLAYMLPAHQPFYQFGRPMSIYDSTPLQMNNPSSSRIPQTSLETRIRNQVHYYFSEENLMTDNFMRMHMNNDGFVHIQFIAGFNKLKALTSNLQLIMDALQDSHIVELKGYEIRSRHMWKKYVMPLHLRVPFVPILEDEMAGKVQNLSLKQKVYEIGSSSSNQKGDK
ncbi:PREDICTED: la-related protein 1C-like [Camelina sativa]|uniref:La-related protein 1C-like n=1 Tax=Camelina sativa TaxID=90675 RepID=A0ABM0XQJ8_CAMSA|nr:PREDICTED: la-related protein 1C-like [Camelina sativa]